ncbi:MAG: hypothetical protein MK193_05190 [Lentisphaeria bacterium]|nr:hypothetical protein [Lentisphaeria bacterium]
MKNCFKKLMLIGVGTISVFLTSCKSSSEVSGDEFAKEYKRSRQFHVNEEYEYLGKKDGMVYILKRTRDTKTREWSERVISTKIDGLPTSVKMDVANSYQKYNP